MSNTEFNFQCIREDKLGDKWLQHWKGVWPHCKKWYLSEGLLRRPGYQSCLGAIEKHMPEIAPLFKEISQKVGGKDISSRFLSLYCPPPYLVGCSQAIWERDELFLIKNYDYGLSLFERTLFYSNWLKPVMGLLDCGWGLLDGINASGLVATLTFGGKKDIGEGFGAPLIIRYILETCDSVKEAKTKIKDIPSHMAYNITLLDKTGDYVKVFMAPHKEPIFTKDPISTNHQETIEWEEYARFSKTLERYDYLRNQLNDSYTTKETLTSSFFYQPLYSTDFRHHFGTIYTSKYYPKEATMNLLWQEKSIHQSFENFIESETHIQLEKRKEL